MIIGRQAPGIGQNAIGIADRMTIQIAVMQHPPSACAAPPFPIALPIAFPVPVQIWRICRY
ncbi:MAG: hypothetical protein C0605_03890 [Hyphomicrobiales bacterium]|nr:MAG: hypothetical protein C0605_03890 [Hyphomicrobiales bacterium]